MPGRSIGIDFLLVRPFVLPLPRGIRNGGVAMLCFRCHHNPAGVFVVILQFTPGITTSENGIVARTSMLLRIATLDAILKTVVVSRAEQSIRIDHRYFWLFGGSRLIPFSDVIAVTYGYSDMAFPSLSDVNHQRWDWFSVGLLLRNRNTVQVFTFTGDGGTDKDRDVVWLPSWLKRLASSNNIHVTSSREFAEELSSQIGVPVTRPDQ